MTKLLVSILEVALLVYAFGWILLGIFGAERLQIPAFLCSGATSLFVVALEHFRKGDAE